MLSFFNPSHYKHLIILIIFYSHLYLFFYVFFIILSSFLSSFLSPSCLSFFSLTPSLFPHLSPIYMRRREWNNPEIIDSQKTSILKFRTGQYMGNAKKQLIFGIQRFPSKKCPVCNSQDADTWLHVLLLCNQHHIHALRTKRHNKAV